MYSWLTIENCVLKFMVEVEKNNKDKPVIWQWWSDIKIIITLFSKMYVDFCIKCCPNKQAHSCVRSIDSVNMKQKCLCPLSN